MYSNKVTINKGMSFSSHNDLLVCFEVYCASHSFEIGSQQHHENFYKCAAATHDFNEEVLKILFCVTNNFIPWMLGCWFIICLVLGQYQAS